MAAPTPPAATPASFLADVPQAPPDPILGVSDAFRADTSPDRLNLGVGAYRTEEGAPWVLPVVREAETRLLASGVDKEYLPIDGLAAFNAATARLLLGDGSPALADGRVATIQGLSGTGSLRVGAAFLAKFRPPGTVVYCSDPTWGNHFNIFGDAGLATAKYRYFYPATVGLDFEGMLADLGAAPPGSVIVLHGCAHNPTGVDPTREQWAAIADVCAARSLLPFFDVAYQGFASGDLDADAWAPRFFAHDKGLEILVAQSYSKNLGLYSERVGALNFVLADPGAATRSLSQAKRIARALYSNPPAHGARIVAAVVGDPALFAQWKTEMAAMAGRIKAVRTRLADELAAAAPGRDWGFVTRQIGMFSFTGLTPAQVKRMTDVHHVYMTGDGRISLAGLSEAKAGYLAAAMADAIKEAA
jgi:aspartate aminotransferase